MAQEEPSELEKLIQEREAKAKERSSILDGAEKERQRIIEEAKAEAARERAQLEKEREEHRRQLQASLADKPLERLRALGVDPKKLLEEGLHEEDPGYQRTRALEKALADKDAEIQSIKKRIEDWDKQTAAHDEQLRAEAQAVARKQAEDRLLELAKARADHGDLRAMYGARDRSFILSGHASADELRELIGRSPTIEEVVEYMAREARKEREAQSSPAGSAQPSGNAPKVTAKQTTLGAQDASVRRASAGDFSRLSQEDQRENLVALANEMLAKPAP